MSHGHLHKGVKPLTNAEAELYLQLQPLDALRFELGLPYHGHLAAMQKSGNFDLPQPGIVRPLQYADRVRQIVA